MGVVIRQSFWGSATMYVGVVIGYISTLIFMPKYLSLDQIGLVRLIQSNATMLIPLSVIGMSGSLVKYYPQIKVNRNERNQFITLQLVTVACSNLLLGALILGFEGYFAQFFEEKSSIYIEYIHLSIMILVCQSFFEYLFALSRSELNIIFPSFLKEIFLRLNSLILVLLFGFKIISFEWVLYLLMLIYFLNTVIFIVFIYFNYKIRLNFHFNLINRVVLKDAAAFSGYSLLLTIGVSIIANIGFLLTSTYLGLEATGIFTICTFIGIIIEMPKRAANQIIGPLLSETFKNRDIKRIAAIYQSASINFGIISILLAIGIISNLSDLFVLIPKGDLLKQGFYVVVGVGLSKLISMFFGPSGEIILYSEFKNYMLYLLAIGSVIMIILYTTLMPLIGLEGAALAVFITTLLDSILKFIVIKKKLGLGLFNRSHLKLVCFSIFIGVLSYIVPLNFNPIVSIILRSILISIFFVLGTYILKISTEFNSIIEQLIQKLRFRN